MPLAPRDELQALTRLDADLLALAVTPVARPSLGPRLDSLQPQIGQSWPGLALIAELLMLDGGRQNAMMIDRLAPPAPLVALGLIRVEGATPHQVIRPALKLIRAMLGRDDERISLALPQAGRSGPVPSAALAGQMPKGGHHGR